MSKTLEELQQQYLQLAAQVGEITYKIQVYQAERKKLFAAMKECNQQAAKLQKKAEAVEKARAAMKVVAPEASEQTAG